MMEIKLLYLRYQFILGTPGVLS